MVFIAYPNIFVLFKNDLSGNTVWPQDSGFQKVAKIHHFWHFWLTFLHLKCKRSSLRSQCWMRLFLRFSNIVMLRNPLSEEIWKPWKQLKSTWQSLSIPFDHLLRAKVPPSPRKADEVGVHYHHGLRPKWTELVGLEGSLQPEESLKGRTKRSSNTIIMIFWPEGHHATCGALY